MADQSPTNGSNLNRDRAGGVQGGAARHARHRAAGASQPVGAGQAAGQTTGQTAPRHRAASPSHAAPRVQTRAAAGTHIAPAYSRGSRRRQKRGLGTAGIIAGIVAAIVVVALVGFGGYTLYQAFFVSEEEVDTVEDGLEVYVTIESGASGDEIAAALSEAHVIDDVSDYYSAVKTLGADQSLLPGVYLFYTHQDPLEVVKQLVNGSNVEGYTLTVSEGLTVEATAAKVEEALGIDADEFIAQAVASNYVADYAFLEDAVNDSLEGFLFPKTYIFTEEPTADSVIRKMLDQYETEVASLDFDSAIAAIEEEYGVEMTEYDILIMASIVEREGLTEEQRYNVASTFYNRLSIGMALQSDATMMYVTGGEVTSADLKTESPYNTYLNTGLPPTPICCPSLEAIQAALDPATTDYLYFYITTDAEYFSETYDEHLAAIAAEN